MNILGISAFYHDSAAALLVDGKLVAAAQEERFSRKRHDDALPHHAIDYCLRIAGLNIDQVDVVAFYDKPFLKFERLLFSYLHEFPRGFRSYLKSIPMWMSQKLWMKSVLRQELKYKGEIVFAEHHYSHAASAFLPSPFESAAILTLDGVGEWSTSTLGVGRGSDITLTEETRFPHSLGLLYSAFTDYRGFNVNSGEYKVMGVAPYGKPTYYDQVRQVIDYRADGSFRLNMQYFDYVHGLRMTNERFSELFGGPPRQSETRLTQREFDIAASIQLVTDEVMLAMARHLREKTGEDNLCMAGGVALNCVSNARVLRDSGFKNLWVQPAAGDAGGALGAAYYFWNTVQKNPRSKAMGHAYLGPEFSREECAQQLAEFGAVHHEPSEADLVTATARDIAQGKVVGWFQGRMEWGPRALGNRSILADARHPDMKDKLNRAIKFREGFRPFAPAVTEEALPAFFELDPGPVHGSHPAEFMLLVAQVREDQRLIPSVTHVDGSARVQLVRRQANPLFHELIAEFGRQTAVPVVMNTSFNVRGEPIVCTPADAYRCFMRTHMDTLVVGPFLLRKEEQPAWNEAEEWRTRIALD